MGLFVLAMLVLFVLQASTYTLRAIWARCSAKEGAPLIRVWSEHRSIFDVFDVSQPGGPQHAHCILDCYLTLRHGVGT